MPTSESKYDAIGEAELEMKKIEDDCYDLQTAVDALLSDFGMKYPVADIASLSSDFAARLSDIEDDLQGPAYRRKSRLEDEIADEEYADLERRRPVPL